MLLELTIVYGTLKKASLFHIPGNAVVYEHGELMTRETYIDLGHAAPYRIAETKAQVMKMMQEAKKQATLDAG